MEVTFTKQSDMFSGMLNHLKIIKILTRRQKRIKESSIILFENFITGFSENEK